MNTLKFYISLRGISAFTMAALLLILSSCGYNTIQSNDEAVTAAWSEVTNQYKRRADLVPNLVKTVKGYAAHEKEVFTQVTEARSKVGQINIDASQLNDEKAMEKFEQAQSQLSSAISRLLMVSENYPQLQASPLYQDLMTQLEGTENRIAVARQRYIQTIQAYNIHIRQFPTLITAKIFGYSTKANFKVDNEEQIKEAPTVDF